MIQVSSPQDVNFSKTESAQKYEKLLKQNHIQYDTKHLKVVIRNCLKMMP